MMHCYTINIFMSVRLCTFHSGSLVGKCCSSSCVFGLVPPGPELEQQGGNLIESRGRSCRSLFWALGTCSFEAHFCLPFIRGAPGTSATAVQSVGARVK